MVPPEMPMSENDRPIFQRQIRVVSAYRAGAWPKCFWAGDKLLDGPVAVKVLFPEYATDASFVERFRREAQAAANLNQPNVVGVYDWGQEAGTYYIVMEYVEGREVSPKSLGRRVLFTLIAQRTSQLTSLQLWLSLIETG